MKVLHLTDFHFTGSKKNIETEKRLIKSLLNSLIKKHNKINYVFFTGDLVFSGENFENFELFKKLFVIPVCEVLEIPITSFFICPGNHDVFRGQELPEITDYFSNIQTNEELDKYVINGNKRSLNASLLNLENYYKFQDEFYHPHKLEFSDKDVDKMYTVHKRVLNGRKIGIITINSSWRANDSKTDSGNLLYPLLYLKQASAEIIDCNIKVLLMHHPLSDFTYWNQPSLEDIIFKDYHLLFSGHSHKNRDTIQVTNETGIYHSTSAATLSLSKDSIGYTLLDIDVDSYDLVLTNVIYEKGEEEFYFGDDKPAQIPVSSVKKEQNKFRITVRKRFDEKKEEANKLFLSYKEQRSENSFIDLFTEPVIKSKSQTHPKPKSLKNITLKELVMNKENKIVFGKDKSGKSAILFKMTLVILHSYNELKVLPIIINCSNSIKTEKPIDLFEEISHFFEINRKKAEQLSDSFHIKILLDDFEANDNLILDPISKYLKANSNASILACADETLFTSFMGGEIGDVVFENIYIHDISRSEIRKLTEKWPNIPSSKKDQVIEKIHVVFKQLNIPANYWTVSLFIWIFEKNIDANFGNNFQLINLYVDSLLDKENFINSKKYKIDFVDLKDFLADLAHLLVADHYESNYQLTYVQLITFVEGYKHENKRFVIDVEVITALIIEKGIFQKSIDGLYTFRLNGVFEYFLGYYMAYNKEFRDGVIEDGHFYLSFKNEFEVCAGLIPQDFDFVERIFNKTQGIFQDVNKTIDFENIDKLLVQKVAEAFHMNTSINSLLKETITDSLEPEDRDSLMESLTPTEARISEVTPKKYYSEITSEVDDLEKGIYILGRVFRNSKLKKKDEFNGQVFEFILNSTCSLSLILVNELSKNNVIQKEQEISDEKLLKILTQFLPMVAQAFFFDMVIQSNMEIILKDKIEELKANQLGNELKLLILYFSLIDLDLKNNLYLVDEIIELIKLPVLKQTTVFKLYMYLSLKANGDEYLKSKLGELIMKQQMKIDSSQNKSTIQQSIQAVSKTKKRK